MSKALPYEDEPMHAMTCCVCGARTIGRQWYNRDYGYGLCGACAFDFLLGRETPEQMSNYYGHEGVHYPNREQWAEFEGKE